jgi:(2S)-methylsuccinyl-CoA dehydrogenase
MPSSVHVSGLHASITPPLQEETFFKNHHGSQETYRQETPLNAVLCLEKVLPVLTSLQEALKKTVQEHVTEKGKLSGSLMNTHQAMVHGFAWFCTYKAVLEETLSSAKRLQAMGRWTDLEEGLFILGTGEYLAQIEGGIPLNQGEICRPLDWLGGGHPFVLALRHSPEVMALKQEAQSLSRREKTFEKIIAAQGKPLYGDIGEDETLSLIREQFYRFSLDKVRPFAHEWHTHDTLIPPALIQEMADMGVFSLTIPEEYGGAGMGKEAMCLVSEELSRGYIGVGSLGTRTEIAAELILNGGTEAQKQHYLPLLASGEILPTAVFTEPNVGSDLGSLKTQGKQISPEVYHITGNKTWITHAARSDLMTLLVRTDPSSTDWRGLTLFLAEKPRGTETEDFPCTGLAGTEIPVLGYRGMKEYELRFEDFPVPAEAILGGKEGQGFKHLMQTFESARIQTAARAIGVAQAAFDAGLRYGLERVQFGQPLVAFPRIRDKLLMMAAELMMTRHLTYAAAQSKDSHQRCDLEAGMAKLLAARVAWTAADNALQIHGGNGFALEYPISRLLCDARVLNIFEGAAEIQAHVIGKRLLEQVSID